MQIQWDDAQPQQQAQPQPFTIGGERRPTTPSGYQAVPGGLAPIPGGPADQSAEPPNPGTGFQMQPDGTAAPIPGTPQAASMDARTRMQVMEMQNGERLLDTIGTVSEQVNPSTTGLVGSVLNNIPGTAATDLSEAINPITAALSFDRLQQMRDASPTGGALGQVSERELQLLGSAVASLSTRQSPVQLRRNLETVRRHYTNWLNTVRQSQGLPVEQERPQLGDFSAVSNANQREVVTSDGGTEAPDDTERRAVYNRVRAMVRSGTPLRSIAAVLEGTAMQIDPNDPAWLAYESARQTEGFDPAPFDPVMTGQEEVNYEEANIDPITAAALGTADMASFSNFDEIVPGDTEDMRAIQEEAQEQQPTAYGGGQVAGALIGPAPVARTVRGAVAAGGTIGGLYGYGSATGNVAERLPSAALGA